MTLSLSSYNDVTNTLMLLLVIWYYSKKNLIYPIFISIATYVNKQSMTNIRISTNSCRILFCLYKRTAWTFISSHDGIFFTTICLPNALKCDWTTNGLTITFRLEPESKGILANFMPFWSPLVKFLQFELALLLNIVCKRYYVFFTRKSMSELSSS